MAKIGAFSLTSHKCLILHPFLSAQRTDANIKAPRLWKTIQRQRQTQLFLLDRAL